MVVAATLDAYDQLMLSFDNYTLPSYIKGMDRVKLAVLRRLPLPSQSATLIASDLAARLLLRQLNSIAMVCAREGT